MASLVVVRRGGEVVARCDQNCYDARHDVCTCVCEGANHGKGIEEARVITRLLHQVWLGRALAEHPDAVFELGDGVTQLPLFPLES